MLSKTKRPPVKIFLPSLLPLLPHHSTNIQQRVISCLTCDSKKSRFAKSAMPQTRLIYVHKVVYRLINTVELNVLSLFLTLAIYKALKYMMAIVSMFTQDIRPQFILTYFYYFPSVFFFSIARISLDILFLLV